MRNFFLISCIFGSNAFFVIIALFGIKYSGAENSSLYILYTVSISAVSLFFFFFDAFKFKRKIKLSLLAIPFIFLGFYLLTYVFQNNSSRADTFFLYFLLWSVPSFFIGMYFSWENRVKIFFKSLDIVLILGSISVITGTLFSLLSGDLIQGVAGSTNQSLSYISAFLFGLNLFLNFILLDIKRFKFTDSKIYSIFYILLLPTLALTVIISGGRGGMMLLIFYCIYFLLLIFFRKYKVRKYTLLISLTVASCLFLFFIENETVNKGLDRAFSYVGEESIDWNSTSNRGEVYSQAIFLIKEEPVLGYGLFGYLKYFPNPHNFFLEVMLSGGLIYFILIGILAIILVKKYIFMTKEDESLILISIIALFPLTFLLFSGTYLVSSELWFIIGFVFAYKNKV